MGNGAVQNSIEFFWGGLAGGFYQSVLQFAYFCWDVFMNWVGNNSKKNNSNK